MTPRGRPFRDRRDAGQRLARELLRFKDEKPIVLALPRGGVPVGYEVARALAAPLDVLLVRKIGAPGYEELGLGAIVEGATPLTVLNEEVMAAVQPPADYLEAERQRQVAEMERRRRLYRGERAFPQVRDRVVILIDDGIATGGTARAALLALRQAGAKRLILAVPVAPADVLARLGPLADDIVCLETPEPFHAVGEHYEIFAQTDDEEVVALLASARAGGGATPA